MSIETIVLKLQRGDSLETDKEKAQNVEHRNFQFSVVKDLLELYKEKAQNIEHRNGVIALEELSLLPDDKEKAQNVERRNKVAFIP